VGGSLAATLTFTNFGATPWRQFVDQTVANLLFGACCVIPCVFLLPSVVPAVRRRFPFPLAWLTIAATLATIGAAGSFVAAVIAVATGLTHSPFWSWYPNSLRVSIYFTLIFGITGTAVQELRSRLASTTLALRTKERDAADARRVAAEAQLASLEARVDPHFLFNTLNSIAALIRENPPAAERVVVQLASLMRSSLDRGLALVPLDEELAIVRSYLEIEHVRFGDRLRFTIEALVEGGAPLVPRLSLQTLVENSVKFAVSPARDGASIRVSASAGDGHLRVAVEDDGRGFDASTLPDGHGLRLLESRLAMTFGERASLRIDSRPGRTIVTLDLPIETSAPAPPDQPDPPEHPRVDVRCA
jgi:sensor histidine kinase YesM